MSSEIWPFLLYCAAVLVVVAGMLTFSYLLGERHHESATGQPYESGIRSTGSAHLRFVSGFYLVAICFLIFDLETVYIFTWAVAARQLGWPGYIGMVLFISILLVGLAYLWKYGALGNQPETPPTGLTSSRRLQKENRQ